MASLRYRRFLKLCEEWPVDETRVGRDLGAFIRQRVAQAFREGESTQVDDPDACDEMYASLNRMNTNYYREKYPRLQDTSFTEVTAEEYKMVLASDNLKQMEEMKKGMWKRLRDKFNVKPSEENS
ncbi:hypothetical protein XENTR_v10013610 [Xenopus tropicalis]|uniref:Ubiquinol-cytochrome-c reductase complex assembly factor 2 n=1 Tax=Xenopus tropicalis TaxID=8364 RepID=UQCC2_XENTR|eukprot:XP_012818590.1 PREDICTED: ubiquinol-cytochrome-c reductase complex assembly factor 2 isoform X1 [Xenopus tropicalis]